MARQPSGDDSPSRSSESWSVRAADERRPRFPSRHRVACRPASARLPDPTARSGSMGPLMMRPSQRRRRRRHGRRPTTFHAGPEMSAARAAHDDESPRCLDRLWRAGGPTTGPEVRPSGGAAPSRVAGALGCIRLRAGPGTPDRSTRRGSVVDRCRCAPKRQQLGRGPRPVGRRCRPSSSRKAERHAHRAATPHESCVGMPPAAVNAGSNRCCCSLRR